MIEIIALIYLAGKMGKLAEAKGQKKGKWRFYTVLAWLSTEFLAAIISVLIFGEDQFLLTLLLVYGSAIASYHILKAQLNKIPDPDLAFEFEQQVP